MSGPVRRWAIVALYAVAIVALAVSPVLMPAGYSWVEHTTSHAAGQGLGGAWLARVGFLAFGLAVLATTTVITWWGTAARVAHLAFGVSITAVSAYSSRPADTALPFVVVEDAIHSFFATSIGFAFAAGVVLTAYRRQRLGGRVAVLDVVAVSASVATPLAMVWFGDIAGAAQRGMFAIAFAWCIAGTLARPPVRAEQQATAWVC